MTAAQHGFAAPQQSRETGSREPIVFLDIDGVLVLKRFLPRSTRQLRLFSQTAVASANWLAAQSGALFVISSSWRLHGDPRPVLAANGVRVPYHADWRTDADGPCRGAEIGRWLAAHGNPPHCVLDDGLVGPGVQRDRLILLDYRVGLVGGAAEAPLRLLRPDVAAGA